MCPFVLHSCLFSNCITVRIFISSFAYVTQKILFYFKTRIISIFSCIHEILLEQTPIETMKRWPTSAWHDNLDRSFIEVVWLRTSYQSKLTTSSYYKINIFFQKCIHFYIFRFVMIHRWEYGTILTIFRIANYWSIILTKIANSNMHILDDAVEVDTYLENLY